MIALLGSAGFEAALAAEVGGHQRYGPAGPWPGVVWAADDAGDPVFARQKLPGATVVRGESVGKICRAAFDATIAAVDIHAATDVPFTLHAGTPDCDAYADLRRRADLVGRQLAACFADRRRRVWRRYAPWTDLDPTSFRRCLVLQAILVQRDAALVAAAVPRGLPPGGTDIAPWPAGAAPIADDRRPPSRAYRKLEEAFRWLGDAPRANDACVDLGGAPGGWAFTALARGARVTAVDRAPLVAPAAGHPRLTALIGNAFTYQPESPVDWLLCDVICEPHRTLALIETWLSQKWCRNLVASVKFKGRDGYRILRELPPLLARAGCSFARVKQLVHNRNEVTVMARR